MNNDEKEMRLAYSYIRFSSPDQKRGDSKRRQIEACENFCRAKGLHLHNSQSFYDEGRSAYKGKHLQGGNLGKFIELVRAGRVPKGSVLIVEAFDRLNRQQTSKALKLFLELLEAGVDVVTLVDGQWFSHSTINENLGQLMMSLGAMWAANNYSATLAHRLGAAWSQKQKLARTEKKPLSPICPAWLHLSKDKTHFEIIPERVKIVRLMFWLKLRGWGKQRIAALLNRHRAKVPTWGVNGRRGMMWHVSYVSKILTSRTVLGEYLPFTGREFPRKPSGAPIPGYYPAVIDEATFLRVQNMRPSPKGPLREKVGNLFQGLLRDGEHSKFSMYYRDHGDRQGKWIYVVSNFCRANPFAPKFSWNYPALESLLLNYLADLDWSSLLADRDAKVRTMKLELEKQDAVLGEAERQIRRLLQLAKTAGDLKEIGDELADLRAKRSEVSKTAESLRRQISAHQNLSVAEAGKMIRQLAKDRHKVSSRKVLREVVRGQVERVELFRKLPSTIITGLKLPRGPFNVAVGDLIQARCVRIVFRNGSERWVVERDQTTIGGLRFDGPTPPAIRQWEINRDELGGHMVVDRQQSSNVKGKSVKMKQAQEPRASKKPK